MVVDGFDDKIRGFCDFLSHPIPFFTGEIWDGTVFTDHLSYLSIKL